MPILVLLGLSVPSYAGSTRQTDVRQTDVRRQTKASLNVSALWGRGIKIIDDLLLSEKYVSQWLGSGFEFFNPSYFLFILYFMAIQSLRIDVERMRYCTLCAVRGCRKFVAPAGSTVTEEGNTATVRCNGSRETWYFTCSDTRWRGQMVNCSNKGITLYITILRRWSKSIVPLSASSIIRYQPTGGDARWLWR